MKPELITLVKTALKKAGLAEELFDLITIEDETQIEDAIGKLKEEREALKTMSADDFKKALEKSGLLDAFNKLIATEGDRRATEAVDTHKKKTQKKVDEDAAIKLKADELKGLSDTDKKISALTDNVSSLAETVKGLQGTIVESSRTSKVETLLTAAKISKDYATFITAEDEAGMKEQVEKLVTLGTAQKQTAINQELEGEEEPGSGGGEVSDTLVNQVTAFSKAEMGQGTDSLKSKALNVDSSTETPAKE